MDLEQYVRNSTSWSQLPTSAKQALGNSEKDYEKIVISYSLKHQLKYRGNLVRAYLSNEEEYYKLLLEFGRANLMLYPYHVAAAVARGLRISAPRYYLGMLAALMAAEKGYDQLPNFTAADIARLLGIRRNQYIDTLNRCRSNKGFFRRRTAPSFDECLAELERVAAPFLDQPRMEPWWLVRISFVSNADVAALQANQREIIDSLIDNGPQHVGVFDSVDLAVLFKRDLIYFDVPVDDDDIIVVPPLEGFVMNCVGGDYLETLLYKVLVAIDAHTPLSDLARNILQVDHQLVKQAVSVFLRLGFASKKSVERALGRIQLHPTWRAILNRDREKNDSETGSTAAALGEDARDSEANATQRLQIQSSVAILGDEAAADSDAAEVSEGILKMHKPGNENNEISATNSTMIESTELSIPRKRLGLLYDSTLTAYLMMGNLTPGLKKHAVTMFEVGKLPDEQLDSLLEELDRIIWADQVAEGEVRRYFEHAMTLRDTIRMLRKNLSTNSDSASSTVSLPGSFQLDLVRCESLKSLDTSTCLRLLQKNYFALVSMAPIAADALPFSSSLIPHFGPPIREACTSYFKFWLYSFTHIGPVTLHLTKSQCVHRLPAIFRLFSEVLVSSANHEPMLMSTGSLLFTINELLQLGHVLIQAHRLRDDLLVAVPQKTGAQSTKEGDEVKNGWKLVQYRSSIEKIYIPLPLLAQELEQIEKLKHIESISLLWKLSQLLELGSSCGYITLLRTLNSSEQESIAAQNSNQNRNPLTSHENRPSPGTPSSEVSSTGSSPLHSHLRILTANELITEIRQGFEESTLEGLGAAPTTTSSSQLALLDNQYVILAEPEAHGQAALAALNSKNSLISSQDGEALSYLSRVSTLRSHKYQLFDVQLGLPLFDQRLNRLILERLALSSFFLPVTLEQQTKSNERLGRALELFLNETPFLRTSHENGAGVLAGNNVTSARNLLFCEGKLIRLPPTL